jgi:hypothetical protein
MEGPHKSMNCMATLSKLRLIFKVLYLAHLQEEFVGLLPSLVLRKRG